MRRLQVDPRENAGQTEPTTWQKRGIAVNSLAEALVPYLSTIRRLREGGGTAYAGSTVLDPDVKPRTQRMSAARRTFDPFRPTYLGPGPAAGRATRPAAADDPVDRALEQIGADMDRQAAADREIDDALMRLAEEQERDARADDAIDAALERLSP